MTGNPNEITAILWLSPDYPADGAEQELSPDSEGEGEDDGGGGDGLRVYDDFSAGRLFSQGVSVYPSVHPDFLSRSGDLDIDLARRCGGTQNSIFVPRQSNRLVLVQARKPFTLVTSQAATAAARARARAIASTGARTGAAADVPVEADSPDAFPEITMLAFVAVLSRAAA